jgi:omega-hydroxy-beta-dihydromenaquinone-9 sulfotransferase
MTQPRTAAPRQILVVGSSRSGTTMMGRVLGRHPDVFTFEELHFFEQLWQPELPPPPIQRSDAVALAARLIAIQREGYHHHGGGTGFEAEAERVVDPIGPALDAPAVYGAFLAAEAGAHAATVACDQTPRNLYYLGEILDLFDTARAVIMIRDPRDVLLSQKNRWKRRQFSGVGRTTRRNAVRTWAGYNPATISLLWRSGARVAARWRDDPRVVVVRFEDLLTDPEAQTRRICAGLGLDFDPGMLDVPRVGSSHQPDQPDVTGIDRSAAGRWRTGLTPTEAWICQRIDREAMATEGYEAAPLRPTALGLAGAATTLATKSVLALALNAGRARNLVEATRRRIGR